MTSPQGAHGWDAVRSQIRAQMMRSETPGEDAVLSPVGQHIFRSDDAEAYYGPTRAARAAVNLVLGLEPSAGQAEWESELGSMAQVERLIHALGDASSDTEVRSAVALLLLDHVDRRPGSPTELLARIRWQLSTDAKVQARMRYWWTHMEGSGPIMAALS